MKASDISSRGTIPVAASASRSAERFRLAGPTVAVDRRVNAVRNDIADVALAGRLFAPHYARPLERRCMRPTVPLVNRPAIDARAVSELRLGDGFALLDESGGWAWGYGLDDRYVGYVPADALGIAPAPTHLVRARSALVFAAPDIKASLRAVWPMGARFVGVAEGDFLATDAGYVHPRHVRAIDAVEADPAAIAEALLGTPYRWGGRSGAGIDCSGLVQLALDLTGRAAPRDSDQQRDALGTPLADDAPLRRGDLIFFPGHVGIMADADTLLHANAHHMAVTREPLAAVVARGAEVIARRRIMP